jgi:hypothetical protein
MGQIWISMDISAGITRLRFFRLLSEPTLGDACAGRNNRRRKLATPGPRRGFGFRDTQAFDQSYPNPPLILRRERAAARPERAELESANAGQARQFALREAECVLRRL